MQHCDALHPASFQQFEGHLIFTLQCGWLFAPHFWDRPDWTHCCWFDVPCWFCSPQTLLECWWQIWCMGASPIRFIPFKFKYKYKFKYIYKYEKRYKQIKIQIQRMTASKAMNCISTWLLLKHWLTGTFGYTHMHISLLKCPPVCPFHQHLPHAEILPLLHLNRFVQ